MNRSQLRIRRAKRTALGRLLCRLVGEETGAVAMEYVVIALLIAAAVVGLVMVFGSRIANMFYQAGAATTQTEDSMESFAGEVESSRSTDQGRLEKQKGYGDTIRGTSSGGNGGESAGSGGE